MVKMQALLQSESTAASVASKHSQLFKLDLGKLPEVTRGITL